MAEHLLARFSLVGGPLHSLGRRLHLVRGRSNSILLGVVLGASLWCVLVVLALVEGLGSRILSYSALDAHVRLLVAIPLFFACEAWVDPRFGAFLNHLVTAKIVPVAEWPALEAEAARSERWTKSWVVEAVLLGASVLVSILIPQTYLFGAAPTAKSEIVGWFYWGACMVVYRFLLLRWIWRWLLWCRLLWRISRLGLRLIPTHPDHAAGLAELEEVHVHFMPLVAGLSAVQSAILAQAIKEGASDIHAIYPTVALVIAVNAGLFVAPLLVFVPKLWKCRIEGLRDYGVFASRYVTSFDEKWVRGRPVDDLLGTPDLQSLADLTNSVSVIRRMRLAPIDAHLLVGLAIAAILPMLPLFLLMYPLSHIVERLVGALIHL